jgi:hypothetical protein
MELIEAYNYTLESIFKLYEEGLDMEIIHPSETTTVETNYEQLSVEKQCNVIFKIKSIINITLINSELEKLRKVGIYFDMGGNKTHRYWILDQSFRCTKKLDTISKKNREDIEKMFLKTVK